MVEKEVAYIAIFEKILDLLSFKEFNISILMSTYIEK